ncbi:MAG: hypothetical protein K9K32_01980 [Halanaerobiales bacterium]|nr:hypothetical protein [Halanaerobiales bacterium]
MEEIFSYWPLIFIIFILLSRILKFINSQSFKKSLKTNLKKQKNQIDDQEVSTNEQVFEGQESHNRPESISQKIERKRQEEKDNKIQIKKLKKKRKKTLLLSKDDFINGVIIKEVLDRPKYDK